METDGGRGFAEMYRNSTEEMFLKSIMESSIGMPVPTMEMLGFKNLSQNFRTDSEELFKSWLTNGETHGYNSPSIAYRTRQASKRISTELVNLSTQQQGGIQKKRSNDVLFPIPDDIPSDLNQQSLRDASERSVQASNLYLAKAWYHSPQPMTRSRSSELRRRYVAMQSTHTPSGLEVMQNASGNGVNNLKQEIANPNGFDEPQMHDTAHQLPPFMSPSNSSSSTFHAPEMGNIDNISSVVSMLKGTLERKKLGSHMEKEAVDDSSNSFYHAQDIMLNVGFNPRKGKIGIHEIPGPLQEISNSQVQDPVNLQTVQESMEFGLEGFVNNPGSTIQFGAVSREASQSESSAAAPVLSSSCFDACDGPSNSSQNPSISESSKKQVGNNSFRGQIIDNLKDERKRGGLARYGSVTSAGSVQKGDPTKKRRVERSRKMAEAKERNLTPAIPTDMQAVLKRCDNLEKEVRSLKLNLSFMNRKDSEQTKQIEELQKQNEELVDEKERLLEEIERIISESAKM